MDNERKEILVYAHWVGFNAPTLMGVLYSSVTKGKELFSFEYNKAWLKLPEATAIDPDLQLYSGTQYLNDEKSNFGILKSLNTSDFINFSKLFFNSSLPVL